jgi:putative transposase
MPRRPRIVQAGVPHHVTQRGNRRDQVFFGDADRLAYLDWLRQYTGEHAVDVLAYCLMPNHVHLIVVPSTSDGLRRALQPLHARYAQRVNRCRGLVGHLWQGRFYSAAMDATHLWVAIRYVEQNPVRAGLAEAAERYRWSSARAHCGVRYDPVLSANPVWQRQFEAVGDWSAWLAAGDDEEGTEPGQTPPTAAS